MKISELIRQEAELHTQLMQMVEEAWQKIQKAEIFLNWRNEPLSDNWSVERYEIYGDNMEIYLTAYAGCNEYDHHSITVPVEAFDNLDAWIVTKQAELKLKQETEAAKKAEEDAKRQADLEAFEKQTYERLKAKFGS